MAIATGAAIALALSAGATAGASIYSAHQAHEASDTAAAAQKDAATTNANRSDATTQQALQLLGQTQQSNANAYAPYTSLGTSGLSALRSTLNLPASGPAPAAGGMGFQGFGTSQPVQSTAAPTLGQIKQFPNGKRGQWDGRGWLEI